MRLLAILVFISLAALGGAATAWFLR